MRGHQSSENNSSQSKTAAQTAQFKLDIGKHDNPLEHEADSMADHLMNMQTIPEVKTSGANQVQRKCAECQHEDEEKKVQRKPAISTIQRKDSGVGNVASNSVAGGIAATKGSGTELDNGTRDFMESGFGADFSNVKIHTGSDSSEMNRDLNSKAFTVGNEIYFNEGQYHPNSDEGKHLLAHELTHTLQQNSSTTENSSSERNTIQRTPAAPMSGADSIHQDKDRISMSSPVDIDATIKGVGRRRIAPQVISPTVNDASIEHLQWGLYDPTDNYVAGDASIVGDRNALTITFILNDSTISTPQQGRYTLRCTGLNSGHSPTFYADRSFWVWTSTPAAKPPDIAALEAQKAQYTADTKPGSKKSFSEVASSFAKLKDVTQDLSILQTGSGSYVGSKCAVHPTGSKRTDCTNIVLDVLEETFTQQGRGSDWAKVKAKYMANTAARGKTTLSGVDVQAALQSELGWKGIYWAPDPKYTIPQAELVGARPDEASYTSGKGTYYKDFMKKGYPGVVVDQRVTDYAPETPNPGYGTASTTTKNTTQLAKLKKLPFGVLSAHGGFHMTIISYGKVIEVHWSQDAGDVNLIQETDLESWAVGPNSGYHYYASGVIVAPASDVAAAFP